MNREQFLKICPQASEDTIRANCTVQTLRSVIRPAKQEQVEGLPLVKAVPRKAKSRPSTEGRLKITYRIYAVRPKDYDNPWTKCLTDLLVKSGILLGDEWYRLTGETISEKVDRKEDERTEIEITSAT